MGFFSKSYGVQIRWGENKIREEIGITPNHWYGTSNSDSELKETLEKRFSRMECKSCGSIKVSGYISLKIDELRLFREETKPGFFGEKIIRVHHKTSYSVREDKGIRVECDNCKHVFTTDGWKKMDLDGIRLINHYVSIFFEHFIPNQVK